MPSNTRNIGNIGESVACKFLESRGYVLIERNYLQKCGEIDIIAVKSRSVRFIEVKTVSRVTSDYRPEELVNAKKLQKIGKTAELWLLNSKYQDFDYQIDVVAVHLDTSTRIARCSLFEEVL